MTSLKQFINGKITCKSFIEGRQDAYDNKSLRIQKSNEPVSEYQSYSKGYAGYKGQGGKAMKWIYKNYRSCENCSNFTRNPHSPCKVSIYEVWYERTKGICGLFGKKYKKDKNR